MAQCEADNDARRRSLARREDTIADLKGKLCHAGETISATLQGYDSMEARVARQSEMVTSGTQVTPQRGARTQNVLELGLEVEELRTQLMESLDARQASFDENTLLKETTAASAEEV